MKLATVSTLALAAMIAPAHAQDAAPEPVDERYVWDLTPFYATMADWEAEVERLQGEVDSISAYEGRLGESAETLLEALDAQSALFKDAARLWVYASNSRTPI